MRWASLAILSAILGFFLSYLILIALEGVTAPSFVIESFSYPMAMLIYITLWLAYHLQLSAFAESKDRTSQLRHNIT